MKRFLQTLAILSCAIFSLDASSITHDFAKKVHIGVHNQNASILHLVDQSNSLERHQVTEGFWQYDALGSTVRPGSAGSYGSDIVAGGTRRALPRTRGEMLRAKDRRARFEELAEANAARRLRQIDHSLDAHTFGRHGKDSGDLFQYTRATKGLDPSTGLEAPKNPATIFGSNRLHINVIERAQRIYSNLGIIGRYSIGFTNHKSFGVGWMRNTGQFVNSVPRAVVHFSASSKVKTGFPQIRAFPEILDNATIKVIDFGN